MGWLDNLFGVNNFKDWYKGNEISDINVVELPKLRFVEMCNNTTAVTEDISCFFHPNTKLVLDELTIWTGGREFEPVYWKPKDILPIACFYDTPIIRSSYYCYERQAEGFYLPTSTRVSKIISCPENKKSECYVYVNQKLVLSSLSRFPLTESHNETIKAMGLKPPSLFRFSSQKKELGFQGWSIPKFMECYIWFKPLLWWTSINKRTHGSGSEYEKVKKFELELLIPLVGKKELPSGFFGLSCQPIQ